MPNNDTTKNEESRQQRPAGGPPTARAVEKAKDFKGTLRKLIHYLADYKWQIVAIVVFVTLSTIFSIISPKLLGNITNQITDDYINIKVYDAIQENLPEGMTLPEGTTLGELAEMMKVQGIDLTDKLSGLAEDQSDDLMELDVTKKPEMNFGVIGEIAGWLIVLYILCAAFGYIEAWIVTSVAQKTAYRFRRELSQKINHMPLSYFDKHSYGDVLSRITNDVDTVSQNLSQTISRIVDSAATIIGILIMMLSISVSMTGVIILTIPISAIALVQIVKRSQKYFKKQQDVLGRLNGHIEETYSGHNIIKIFGSEQRVATKFDRYNNGLAESSWKAQFISGLMMPIMSFINNVGYVATCVLGGKLVIDGKIKIGDVQAFIEYVQQFDQPLVQIANISNVVQSTVAAAERVFEFIEQPDEKITWEGDGEIIDQATGEVEFNHIKFGYDEDQVIIKDFSAKVKPGQKIAIVGPTGAGKTTMINLLMRFYDPDSGTIKLNGIDTTKISRKNVRKNFGMVLQDTWLFTGTVKENLLYGKPNATDDELKVAVKAARADHVIRALPQGYNTVIDESANNISAGEKQLLTIARAMLANAPILILDEATSNVDTRTEELIQQAMDKLMEGRTSFIIAHRLSTIRNADLILVLDHGDIVESGNHDQLMAKNGFYANLYNSQFDASSTE